MSLVTSHHLLQYAYEEGFALGAFNIFNLESLKAVLLAARDLNSPVIIQVTEKEFNYINGENIKRIIDKEDPGIPVVLHLDHGSTIDSIRKAISAGFTSVMFDGSHKNFERNVKLTKEAVNLARKEGVQIEAELGQIVGGEEMEEQQNQQGVNMTRPNEASKFAKETGVDSLAVSIGNAHGVYKGKPNLDFERLKAIKNATEIPLVLHGGTGISEADLKKATQGGICKVNIGTELNLSFIKALEEILESNHGYNAREICAKGQSAIKESVENKINSLNSNLYFSHVR